MRVPMMSQVHEATLVPHRDVVCVRKGKKEKKKRQELLRMTLNEYPPLFDTKGGGT